MNTLILNRIITKIYHYWLSLKFRFLRQIYDRDKIFRKIHADNFWASKESVSGVGSEISYTVNLRECLNELISTYDIKSICDAPCGDFNWIGNVLSENSSISYTGIDIVPQLIDKNNELYKTEKVKFIHGDICTDPLPKSDLLIVRDVLFHLSNQDLMLFKENLRKTEFKYLLVSQHSHGQENNKDIRTGDFRELDVGLRPLYFPTGKVMVTIDDCPDWYPIKRTMILFSRGDLFG